ncbi:MAG: hypothetical protein Kow00105_01390 [Phycisphaeraceae bacterium]
MKVLASVLSLCVAASASAAVVSSTQHGATGSALNGLVQSGDLLSGLIGVELPGDQGWHPANPASGNSLLPQGLPAFTNDSGESGLAGLLNDFPGPGAPTKRVQYTLNAPSDIGSIGILSGNDGLDGRVFSTTVISYSTDGGANFSVLGYFQSDPSGTINAGQWGSTYVTIWDDASITMLSGVTDLIFEFYAVDNTGGQLRDPYDGVNPFTGVDDGLGAAFVSPLIWEIDVTVPEPASLSLLALGGLAMIRRR